MKSKIIVSLGVKKVNTECGIIPKVVPDLMALNFSALCSIRNVSKKSGNSHSTHYCLVKKRPGMVEAGLEEEATCEEHLQEVIGLVTAE